MKRINYLLFCFVLLFCFSSVSFAENYKSKKFPPDQILAKMVNKRGEGNCVFTKVVGKYKMSDNTYKVFFSYVYKRQFKHRGIGILTNLDNGLWVFDYEKNYFHLLEK